MNEPEAFQLLTLASVRDGRQVTKAHAQVWADDLRDVHYDEAVDAARLHYRESTDWMMPAHVRTNVRRVRRDRARLEARNYPAIEHVITLDPEKHRSDTEAARLWFREHPDATTDEYIATLDLGA